LLSTGYNCEIFGGVPELTRAYAEGLTFDRKTLFVNMSDGLTQEYSRVQIPVLCDMLGVKYSGSGPFEVALMTNKHYTKLAVSEHGIRCPQGDIATSENYLTLLKRNWTYPVMIKPNTEGSSVGITQDNVCFFKNNLEKQLQILLGSFSEVVVEEYIPGADVTCFLLGNPGDYIFNEVLLVEHHGKRFFEREVMEMNDHAFKRTSYVMGDEILSGQLIDHIKNITIAAAAALNAHDIIRVDYRISPDGRVFFLEANTVPRVSFSSELGFVCKAKGLSYPSILSEYIQSILRRINRD
ncbi:MAG: hypothetical protein NC489_38205, partial [Ruminococcus flavefaciens]|nr:hypothetical protein [Ruminococcus flavefaciens]